MFSYHHQSPVDVIWKDYLLQAKSTDCDIDEDNSNCECSIRFIESFTAIMHIENQTSAVYDL